MAGKFAHQYQTEGPVAFVFDEGNLYRDQFASAYGKAKQEKRLATKYSLVPLTFCSDSNSPELQAADLFAWSLSRVIYDQ